MQIEQERFALGKSLARSLVQSDERLDCCVVSNRIVSCMGAGIGYIASYPLLCNLLERFLGCLCESKRKFLGKSSDTSRCPIKPKLLNKHLGVRSRHRESFCEHGLTKGINIFRPM